MDNKSKNGPLPGGLLLGIGNPLLDISANVDEELLKKYDMKADSAILGTELHKPLYGELIDKYKAEFIAGGSVQNSLRVAQWILKSPNVCTYFGCVGKDDYARILKDKAIADGVRVQYQESDATSTGRCAVLVTGTHRSLCADLGAAEHFTPEHLATEQSKRLIECAKYFYVSGFFMTVSPESIMQLAAHAHAGGHVFIMNLSAPFVSQFYQSQLEQTLPYIDILFGNETEAEAFAKAFNINETDLGKIALKIASMPKLNKDRQRCVVITQGCEPTILVDGDQVTLIPVMKLSREQIVDTNGAGDAFTGGFLSQLILGKPYTTCVKCAIYAATHVIQHAGCTFSGDSEFDDS